MKVVYIKTNFLFFFGVFGALVVSCFFLSTALSILHSPCTLIGLKSVYQKMSWMDEKNITPQTKLNHSGVI
jgi:hypothetical protein